MHHQDHPKSPVYTSLPHTKTLVDGITTTLVLVPSFRFHAASPGLCYPCCTLLYFIWLLHLSPQTPPSVCTEDQQCIVHHVYSTLSSRVLLHIKSHSQWVVLNIYITPNQDSSVLHITLPLILSPMSSVPILHHVSSCVIGKARQEPEAGSWMIILPLRQTIK